MSGKTTEKASGSKPRPPRDDMRREYRFDYRKARPNRFAAILKGGTTAVVLDRDVASVVGGEIEPTLLDHEAAAPCVDPNVAVAPTYQVRW